MDNGFRPPGLIRMSATTVVHNDGNYILQDQGANYSTGTATHYLTMYRASSGALVFSAGTVQWAWGLDDHHALGDDAARRPHAAGDGQRPRRHGRAADDDPGRASSPPRPRPTTRRPPRPSRRRPPARPSTPASPSPSRARPPTPAASSAASRCRPTAAPRGTRPPGTTSWSYQWAPKTLGSATIRVRAADDSANRRHGGEPHGQRRLLVPVHAVPGVGHTRHARGQRRRRRRARRAVHARPRRPHHRRPLLQGHRQHRHPHRQPLDDGRRAARHRHVHQRDGDGLAAGQLRHARGGERQHDLRRLVLRAERPLRRRQRVLHARPTPARRCRRRPRRPRWATASTAAVRPASRATRTGPATTGSTPCSP